jgi:serine/threonine protein kinase
MKTPQAEYMPPELLVGQSKTSKHTVTKAQDVWAFGIVMYAVLFADLPWSRADRDDPDFALFVCCSLSLSLSLSLPLLALLSAPLAAATLVSIVVCF